MRYFSLTQLVDFCISKHPNLEAVRICVNTKKTTENRYHQQQVKPCLIKIDKTYTYHEFCDEFLDGEDYTLSFKLPPKWPKEYMVIDVDTVVRTSQCFDGHYYAKSFKQIDGNYLDKAQKAQKEIKTLDEIQLDEIAITFD
jgi:hypothetical protein